MTTTDIGSGYNPFDQQFLDDPQPQYRRMHETPVVWSEHFEAYVVTRYQDVVDAVDHPKFCSHGKSGPMPPMEVMEELAAGLPMTEMLYSTDDPVHGRLRTLIQAAMSSVPIPALEKAMAADAAAILDRLAAAGGADLYPDFVQPYCDAAIMTMVGVPPAEREQVLDMHHTWERLFIPGQEPDNLREETRKVVRYQHHLADMIERRRQQPASDLLTGLAQARADGYEPLTTAEMVWGLIELIGAAGNTHYGMINVLLRVLQDRKAWQELKQDPELLAVAVDEGLRVESPVLGCAREASDEIEFGGTKLPAGAPILIAFAAANHDGGVFSQPGEFDLHRPNANKQVTLGRGAHYCIGARVGRSMIRIGLAELLRRFPDAHITPGQEPRFFAPFPFLRAVEALPVRWNGSAD